MSARARPRRLGRPTGVRRAGSPARSSSAVASAPGCRRDEQAGLRSRRAPVRRRRPRPTTGRPTARLEDHLADVSFVLGKQKTSALANSPASCSPRISPTNTSPRAQSARLSPGQPSPTTTRRTSPRARETRAYASTRTPSRFSCERRPTDSTSHGAVLQQPCTQGIVATLRPNSSQSTPRPQMPTSGRPRAPSASRTCACRREHGLAIVAERVDIDVDRLRDEQVSRRWSAYGPSSVWDEPTTGIPSSRATTRPQTRTGRGSRRGSRPAAPPRRGRVRRWAAGSGGRATGTSATAGRFRRQRHDPGEGGSCEATTTAPEAAVSAGARSVASSRRRRSPRRRCP